MRLDPSVQIVGVPLLQVREFLRRHHGAPFDARAFTDRFGLLTGDELLAFLATTGLIERAAELPGDYFRTTGEAGRLIKGLASRPVTRGAADPALAQFIERCRQVNSDQQYVYKVERAIVFGSYLGDGERLGDVDIAVRIVPRREYGDELIEVVLHRARLAERNGRRFGSYVERLAWAEREVRVVLKNRSRILQFSPEDDAALDEGPRRVIFEEPRP